MDTANGDNPEGPAVPDDQGNLGVCTRTALAKAIGNGFMEKDFAPGKELDFNQSAITQILVNEHKDGVGKWPTEFDGKSYHLQEVRTKMWWIVKLNVNEIKDFKKMPPEDQDELLRDMEDCEFVLNYFYKHPKAHAIYAESYNVKKNWLKCVNSNGEKDQYPRVPIKDILNLYRVTCTAVMDKRDNYGKYGTGTSQAQSSPDVSKIVINNIKDMTRAEERDRLKTNGLSTVLALMIFCPVLLVSIKLLATERDYLKGVVENLKGEVEYLLQEKRELLESSAKERDNLKRELGKLMVEELTKTSGAESELVVQLYRLTGVVISSASTGGAAQHLGHVLGHYEYVEDKGCYVQSSTEQDNEAIYLYSHDGKWYVGITPGERRGWLLNRSPSQIPPTRGWMWADGGSQSAWDLFGMFGPWHADDTISVTPGPLPPLPRQFIVTVTGAAAETHPSYQGVFTRTERWLYGRPVYVNTEGALLYHNGADWGWSIGPKLSSIGLSGSRAHSSR